MIISIFQSKQYDRKTHISIFITGNVVVESFFTFFSIFSSLGAKTEQFELKGVSYRDEESTSVDPPKFFRQFQITTRVSQHILRTVGIRENKRHEHTTHISISICGNVSYGAFLRVQKGSERFSRGFYEEFNENTQKSDENGETS